METRSLCSPDLFSYSDDDENELISEQLVSQESTFSLINPDVYYLDSDLLLNTKVLDLRPFYWLDFHPKIVLLWRYRYLWRPLPYWDTTFQVLS